MADFSDEKWYPLLRNSTRGEVKGEIKLKIQLEAIEPNVVREGGERERGRGKRKMGEITCHVLSLGANQFMCES